LPNLLLVSEIHSILSGFGRGDIVTFDKRMEDKYEIPEMNGTVQELLRIISETLPSHKHNSDAIKSIAKIDLHIYLLEKKILEQLVILNSRSSKVNSVLVDKVVPQLITFSILGLLWILFQNFKP
jgi:hypothetical protein